MQIILTPTAKVQVKKTNLGKEPGDQQAQIPREIYELFHKDWLEAIFRLAGQKEKVDDYPVLAYWREFGEKYINELCHLPPGSKEISVKKPAVAYFQEMILEAPPMFGGEYLSLEVLNKIWEQLDRWTGQLMAKEEDLETLLKNYAPRWNQVGRVSFHLAENKTNPRKPFAFLATYSTGYKKTGRLKHLPLSKAFAKYAGTNNREILLNLLVPVQRAAEKLDWVREIVQSGELYKPMAWDDEKALRFLKSAEVLQESGLIVKLPNWWKKRRSPKFSMVIERPEESRLGMESLLNIDISVMLGDQILTRSDIEELLKQKQGLVLFKGQWVEVDRKRLQQVLDHWNKIDELAPDKSVSFVRGMRLLAGTDPDLSFDSEEEDDWVEWSEVIAGSNLKNLLSQIRRPRLQSDWQGITGLNATLRSYQKEGFVWLDLMSRLGLGACLADDMGLGKTIQILALLLDHKNKKSKLKSTSEASEQEKTNLLVVPASLLGNWKSETERFTPQLDLKFLHASQTSSQEMEVLSQKPEKLLDYDLVVTTYAMVHRLKWLAELTWDKVILDESQAIKNPETLQSKAVRKLERYAAIALTGTPIENNLNDLWSLFDFLNPGLLGSAKLFKSFLNELNGPHHFAPLRKLVRPYILRRMKTDSRIIDDLPEKTEVKDYCLLTPKQVEIYKNKVEYTKQKLEELKKLAKLEGNTGMQRRGLVLSTIMGLKQICNHPVQYLGHGDYEAKASGKFKRIKTICSELAQRQEKILVFTQYREIINPLFEVLRHVFGEDGLVLHGGTPVGKRKDLVNKFQDPEGPPFFLLSLKAGGSGLNLTAASHVIHFDRWWNPAVENQATDRAFRIGQKKNVMVHKFVTRGTIEEKIDLMISDKKELAQNILGGKEQTKLTEMSDDEIIDIISLDLNASLD